MRSSRKLFAKWSLAKWSLSNNYFGSFDVGLGLHCFVSVIRAEAPSLPM